MLICLYLVSVTVQCIRDGQFVVVVARDVTVPRLSLDTVSLLGGNDPPCSPVASNPYFAVYQFPVSACGTNVIVSIELLLNAVLHGLDVNGLPVCRRNADMWCMKTEWCPPMKWPWDRSAPSQETASLSR